MLDATAIIQSARRLLRAIFGSREPPEPPVPEPWRPWMLFDIYARFGTLSEGEFDELARLASEGRIPGSLELRASFKSAAESAPDGRWLESTLMPHIRSGWSLAPTATLEGFVASLEARRSTWLSEPASALRRALSESAKARARLSEKAAFSEEAAIDLAVGDELARTRAAKPRRSGPARL